MSFDQQVQALRDSGVHVTWDTLRARGLTPPRSRASRFPDCLGVVRRSDNGQSVDLQQEVASDARVD